ncbi:MAG: flavodoxin domain-containing protein [Spirochaetaceae bacterium]
MHIIIVHDSAYGNGERLAKILKEEFEKEGHTAKAEHVSNVDPDHLAAEPPEMLVLGAAIRRFTSSPATKKWLRRFAKGVKQKGRKPAFAALFVTHALPLHWADRWGKRLLKRLERSGAAERVYKEWLSGRVTSVEGPLEETADPAFRDHARELLEAAVPR